MRTSPISFDDAKKIDKFLFDLCVYECAGGKMYAPESIEDFMSFQKRAVDLFNKLKRAIQTGEVTLEDIEAHIVSRNAALRQLDETETEDIDAAIKRWEQEEGSSNLSIAIMKEFMDYLSTASNQCATAEMSSKQTEKTKRLDEGDTTENDGEQQRDENGQDD